MRAAFVHDWLVTYAGAEKVLESLLDLYPAPVYTLFHDPAGLKGSRLASADVRPSILQGLPFSKRLYRNYLPLYPMAAEHLDVSEFDLLISNSHAAAKGILTRPDQLHLSYCLTPFRYAWDLYHLYLREAKLETGLKGWSARAILHYIRLWDQQTAARVDHFATLSHYVARRIKRIYGRDAEVIYPPVDVRRFTPAARRGDHFITVSRLVPYKRVPLIARAFREKGLKLLVVGDGPDRERVKAECGGAVEYLGRLDDKRLVTALSEARAFVFAAEEDFGIAPVEAMACGVPVIALGQGAACETVVHGRTGVLFPEATTRGLSDGIDAFLEIEDRLDPAAIRAHAERFSEERFKIEFRAFVEKHREARLGRERRPAGAREIMEAAA